ncbi:hypothetical protein [Aliidiomarina soli]|uniref:Outer membrane protein beta-barrel domain-containing protein n=1 Tax=Aliidiomarina soli TaxID=1928574 RepID=A0A432WJW5_9GAMM|nr:hypothetical protein [Aliidiomarina soli]RUO33979.1 hypothetical protein CWE14_05910 [Aliidiomarina soli]
MPRILVCILTLTLFLPVSGAQAKEGDLTFGLGLGFSYSGLGGYAAHHFGKQSIALSAGLTTYSSYGHSYGAGLSWRHTGLLSEARFAPNRHALGVYIGAIGDESYTNKTVWGGGPSYHYYSDGMQNTGLVVGLSFLVSDGRDRRKMVALSLGYQF